MKHHFIRELVEHGVVDLEYVTTQKKQVDTLTKPLNGVKFEEL